MKHVKHLLVLLLLINCTTDSAETENTPELSIVSNATQNCIDDLPKVRLTNNGTHSFEFLIYGEDYTLLHSQNISTATNSGWVELSENDVLVVASNNLVYGQKRPLNLDLCDNLELEIDANNILLISGE
ncbi:hypothetical protein [Winogradskyella pulchriflava]|uniref:Uncharacterized protein n=1 Tax=Winogradskyella pulchriflava TaxID=1110688 RepID=A0ABV6Q450_9FLAO